MLLALLACVLDPLVAPPHPTPPTPATTDWTPTTSPPLRLHALQTGETTVPFGQFYNGNEGWVGKKGVWRTGFDRRTFWAPVLVYAVTHPTEGVVLIDAGLSEAQNQRGYYRARDGGRAAYVWQDSENRLPEDQLLTTQLAALGVAPDQVRHVVITHLHEDHLGELGAFPQATAHISALEWDDRGRVGYGPSYEAAANIAQFEFDGPRVHTFGASHDLFGDGSVILLPTPGHTLGHTAVLLALGGGGYGVATGDAMYTLRHLDPGALTPFNYIGEQAHETLIDSVDRLRGLQAALGDAVFLLPHDPFDYGDMTLRALEDGALTVAERGALRRYQDHLFDGDGRLLPEATPRWDRGAVVADLP